VNEVLRQQLIREIVTARFQPESFDRLVALHSALSQGCTEPLEWFDLLGAARKHPGLFSQSPDTLNGNVTRSAELMGLAKEEFVAAARKQPQLFCQSPDTLNGNVTRSAALMGLAKDEFVAAARKQPQLFSQSPDTLNGKLPYLKAIAEALGQPLTTSQIIAKFPTALSYAANHLHLRYALAKTGHATALTSVITMPSAKAEAIAVTHYQSQIAHTGTGRRTLQVMHAKGLLKSLPPGIDPIPRPTPWRERCL
jgi:hypothetical protein